MGTAATGESDDAFPQILAIKAPSGMARFAEWQNRKERVKRKIFSPLAQQSLSVREQHLARFIARLELASSLGRWFYEFLAFLPSCFHCLIQDGDGCPDGFPAHQWDCNVFAARSVCHPIFRAWFIKRIIFTEQELAAPVDGQL